jgi:transcription initiation factor TFIIIB Brf1 subunit/transcription initiation factor TFIIB
MKPKNLETQTNQTAQTQPLKPKNLETQTAQTQTLKPKNLETQPTQPKNLETQTNQSIEKAWSTMFDELQNDNIEITTDTLVGAAIYSISAIEALEQMQSKLDNRITFNQQTKQASCDSCGGILRTKDNVMICQACGLEIQGVVVSTQEDESITTSQDANVNDKGFVSMKIIGKGAYGLNRNLLKNCADYPRYRKMTTLKEMHNWNSQSNGNQLPKNVINEANDMFATIKDHGYVFRKDVKKGVQGACLYYTCHVNGISRTPIEIAKLVGIAEKFLSAGDRYLRDLNERGIINIPSKVDAINSYVNRYFELLKISNKYKPFVLDMIRKADDDRLHVLYDSKSNTKCIGTIYMLIDRIPELRKTIDKERIERECDISKTTFIKYYAMISRYYRRFAHIFALHKIPLKSEWRENIHSLEVKPKKVSKIIYTKRKYHNQESKDPIAEMIANELKMPAVKPIIIRTVIKPKNVVKTELPEIDIELESMEPVKKNQMSARLFTRLSMH